LNSLFEYSFLYGSLISVAGAAFLRASAKIGKIQFNLSLPLRRYAPAGSRLRKE
jgi:hypothetical protein